jgi:hypothetical protein
MVATKGWIRVYRLLLRQAPVEIDVPFEARQRVPPAGAPLLSRLDQRASNAIR